MRILQKEYEVNIDSKTVKFLGYFQAEALIRHLEIQKGSQKEEQDYRYQFKNYLQRENNSCC